MQSKKPNPVKLTPSLLEHFKLLVAQAAPGKYTLRQLYGKEAWGCVRRQALGIVFKATVRGGKILRIRWLGKQSNKSQLYEVLPCANTSAEMNAMSESAA